MTEANGGTVTYYQVTKYGSRAHIIAEAETRAEAILLCDHGGLYSEEQMRAIPPLRTALEQWDADDRSAYAHDVAFDVLGEICSSHWSDVEWSGRDRLALFREHAARDALCATVVELIDWFDRIRVGVRDLGVNEASLSAHRRGSAALPDGEVSLRKLTPTELWDMRAAEDGAAFAVHQYGPRPAVLKAV